MTTPITPDNLPEIEARANAATESYEKAADLCTDDCNCSTDGGFNLKASQAMVRANDQLHCVVWKDIPALCAALREAWAENERLKEAAHSYIKYPTVTTITQLRELIGPYKQKGGF